MASDQHEYMEKESFNYEENPNLSTFRGLEDSRKHDGKKDVVDMPAHFLSANNTEMPMTVQQNLSTIKTEESDEVLDDSDEEEIHPPEHFLSHTNGDSDDGMEGSHSDDGMEGNHSDDGMRGSPLVGASGESDPRYSVIHVHDMGKYRKMYMCNRCEEDFTDKRIVIRHVRAHVWAEKPLQCDHCEMGFDKKWMLDRHLKTHEKTRDFACNVCGRAFYLDKLLIEHVMRVHNEQHQNIERNEDSIIEGKESDHGLENTDYGLDDIRKENKDKETVDMQKKIPSSNVTELPLAVEPNPSIIKIEESDPELENSTDNADKEEYFPTGHFLSQTYNDSDEGEDVNHVVGASAESLWTQTHFYDEGGKQVRYSCNVCEEDFIDKRVCIRHVQAHTGENPFKCEQCGQCFGSEDSLKMHSKSHTGQKPFACRFCNKVFGRKDSLDEHLILHKGMPQRPFPCNQCEKSFVKRFHLERHLKTHANISNFICTICGQGFNEKKHLIDHANQLHDGHNPNIMTNKDSGLEESRIGNDNIDALSMPKQFRSEESGNHEQKLNISKTKDSNCGIENIRKVNEEKDAFYMANHFISSKIAGITSAVEPKAKRIKTEESNRFLVNSMSIADKDPLYRPEHFLSQSNDNSDVALNFNHFVGGSAETLFTINRVTDGGRKRNRYSCNLCELDFKDKRNCIRHIRSHTGEKPYPCDQCDKGFDKRWFLERHKKVHEKTRDFICNECGKAFFQKRHLIDHEMRLHNEQNPDITRNEDSDHGLENRRTEGENIDALYMQKYFYGGNNTGMPLAAEQNPSIIETKESHRELENSDRGLGDIRKDGEEKDVLYTPKHILSDNNTEMPLAVEQNSSIIETKESNQGLEDSNCGLDVKKDDENMDTLSVPKDVQSTNITGMPLAVEPNTSIIKTEKDDEVLEDRMDITDNESFYRPEHFLSQTNGDSDEGMEVNHVVGASAETLYTLTHTYETGRKRVRYSCNVCEKDFNDKRQCIRHIRVHTGEKPFKCYQCGENFGTEGNLSRHIRTHTGEKPYSCHLCNKCFTTKNSLEQHLLLHADVSERPFPCNQCDKGFVKRSHLERHLKTHAQIREFVCTVCGKDFSEKRHLLDHTRRRHTDKVQPACTICNREFWSEYHLRMHMRAHIDGAEEQLFQSFPTFVSKDENEIQASPENPSIETSDSHSLFGNSHSLFGNAVSQQQEAVQASTLANSTQENIVEASVLEKSTLEDRGEANTLANPILEGAAEASNLTNSTVENTVGTSTLAISTVENTVEASTLANSTQGNIVEASILEKATLEDSEANTLANPILEGAAEASNLANSTVENTVGASTLAISTVESTVEASTLANST